MRYRIVALLVAAFAVGTVGADAIMPGKPVHLLTSDGPSTCYLNFVEGDLSTDPVAGTAINENGHRMVVMWPPRYSGRQTLLGVTVLNSVGDAVARTGTRVRIGGAQLSPTEDVWLGCWVIQP